VKVYEVLVKLFIAGDQTPRIPLIEELGSENPSPEQMGGISEN
jgi:hypothetical protein